MSATNTWAGGLLSRRSGGSSAFYTWDPSGNVAQRLSATGAVLSAYAVDAYGGRAGTDASTADPYAGFGGAYGYYADAETGLSLLGHRYYDAGTGRFITRDPLGYAGGYDLYAFCGGNPVMLNDPFGFSATPGSGLYGDGQYGWPDYLKEWADKNVRGGPASVPGLYTNPLDIVRGVLGLGSDIEHLGSGSGAHFGDPSRYGWNLVGKDAVTFTTVVAGGLGAASGLGKAAARGALEEVTETTFTNCFVAGTPVQMADGATEPIEQVKAGDLVVSRDPTTGQTEAKRVKATFSRDAEQVLTLTLADLTTGQAEDITCTPGHPFYVAGVGFVLAGDLGIGTQIMTRAGPSLTVTGARWHGANGVEAPGARVYNFTVQGDHTYFVGTIRYGAWVHNSSPMFRAHITDDAGNKLGFGQSTDGPQSMPDWLKNLVDSAPHTNNRGGCAEVNAIIDSGLSPEELEGKTATALRNGSGPNANKVGTPCPACQYILDQLGMKATKGSGW